MPYTARRVDDPELIAPFLCAEHAAPHRQNRDGQCEHAASTSRDGEATTKTKRRRPSQTPTSAADRLSHFFHQRLPSLSPPSSPKPSSRASISPPLSPTPPSPNPSHTRRRSSAALFFHVLLPRRSFAPPLSISAPMSGGSCPVVEEHFCERYGGLVDLRTALMLKEEERALQARRKSEGKGRVVR